MAKTCKNHADRKLESDNKTGLCGECYAEVRRQPRVPKRICTTCPNPVTRHSSTGQCYDCMDKARKKEGSPTDSLVVTGDTAVQTKVVDERIMSLDDLIRVLKIDTNEWVVERWVANKWEMGSAHKGHVKTTELFQIKAWLKRNKEVNFARAQIDALIADAEARIPRFIAPLMPDMGQAASPYFLELQVPDLHLGKLAWGRETGYDNYDSKIAVATFKTAVAKLVERTRGYTFRFIVLVVGNDLLHSDTKQGTTTKGTPLDVDSRYHKNYLAARRMICEAIEELSAIAPVVVKVVPGNHDTLSAFHLGDAVQMYFRNAHGVVVDNEPRMRKYLAFGKVLLMWTHGNTGKLADYPLLMSREVPEWWGRAKFIECHTGDKHQTKVLELHGVRVRISPALCAPDAWHSEHHFVGAQRAAEAYVWHAEEGLIGMSVYTVQPEEQKLCQ